jgi:putative MFS transporter
MTVLLMARPCFETYHVAFFLKNFGVPGVFAFIAVAMAIVAIAIGAFGPRTNHRPLEEISH